MRRSSFGQDVGEGAPRPGSGAASGTRGALQAGGGPIAVAAVLAAMTLVVLDAGMTNLALPTLAGALGLSPARVVLVVTVYQTVLLVGLFPSAALGERVGYRRVFAAGAWLFVIGSGACALAPSLPWLIAARGLQGLGGAAIMALGVPLLRFAVSPGQLGAAIGWNALTVALASSAGPGVGALILSNAGWPWLYAANIPIGVVVIAACRWLPSTPAGSQRLDGPSLFLSASMFASLFIGVQIFLARPVWAGGLVLSGILCLGLLIRREAPKPAPVIPLDLLRERSLRLSAVASVLCFAGQGAAMGALPFYLQQGLGQSTAETGVYMTAWPVAVAVSSIAASRLAEKMSTARLCAIGGGMLASGLLGAALWPMVGDLRPMLLFTAMCGVGFGLFQTPNNRNLFLSAPLERSAASGGLQGAARLTGQTSGAVLLTVFLTLTPVAIAPRFGLAAAAFLALAAALVSLAREQGPDQAKRRDGWRKLFARP